MSPESSGALGACWLGTGNQAKITAYSSKSMRLPFADLAWMNENRVFKMFPEWGGYTGCTNASMQHFYSKRPTPDSASDSLSRADT
ncbi:hypothetical protein B0H63DRAFT_522040 [Podospora didyma]|uniref:Uncharacterized protein n=1 Tax=Podospora didyma TaxID=330526 RepID=A0AAE0NUK7_9PEZI|nr:hypothetical protein B0H63DRAFT_522040 [Podospora didyma]